MALVDEDRRVLAETVRTQLDEHALYGGVVPEIAARAHVESLDRLVARVMAEAGLGFADLSAVAATAGPGLIGGLLVGLTTAKAICLVHGLPLIAVNHLEAHALTARLTDDVAFPYLLLLVSGGHCQLVEVNGVGSFRRLGSTVDDALGEAFDKVAKMLGLGFPGGPAVERAAASGDPARFDFPRPMLGRPGCSFSFSGLKTAVRQAILSMTPEEARAAVPDICASFQAAVAASVADRTVRGLRLFQERHPGVPASLVVAGGVAANAALREALRQLTAKRGVRLVVPPPRLCTDNGTMIAWAGMERLVLGQADPLDTPARARWPLDPAAEPALGGGGKGPKA